ncbi:hypothetical protein [Clostridium thermarum]|nr:hypothetical protein [Clostridium thermarum]
MTRVPRYKQLKSILASNQDIIYLEKKNAHLKALESKSNAHGYVRGAEYYGGGRYDR